jgi:hypothetical protein
MSRHTRIRAGRKAAGQPRTGAAGLVRAALVAAVLALAVSASPAHAATGAPVLIAPTASSTHNSPLSIEYKLSEAGSAAAISFVPSTGPTVVVTLTPAALAVGKHHFFLDLGMLESETANVAAASTASLPDGDYTVALSYQNAAHDPAASTSAEKVTIKTLTGAPTVSEPKSGQVFRKPLTVHYTLPEAALAGSVKLLLAGTHAGAKTLVLANTEAGAHTAEVVPSNLALGSGVVSAPSERLPTDSYQLSLSYQDALGNPIASAVPIAIEIGYPLCKAGSYSASGGEEPCTEAPKGYFVPAAGAMTAEECDLGQFAPEEGLSECLLASPGHYVPATGAKDELECEQGTYSGETGRSSCLGAPPGHYAPKGAVAPTACSAGKFDAHTNSPSAEFCEYDSPGWYSGEGASEATPCPAGTNSPAGASSCTVAVSKESSGGASNQPNTTAGAGTSTTLSTVVPSPVSKSPVAGPVAKFAIAATRHGTSLVRTRGQRYLVTCSSATTVQLRVAALIVAGKQHATLAARTVTLRCKAAKGTEATASFKLTGAAKKLLARHGTSVKLVVHVYATGSAAGTPLASATLHGTP